jgi:hypothetical protein
LITLGFGASALSVACVVPILVTTIDIVIRMVVAGLVILIAVLVPWVFTSTYYEVGTRELKVVSGPFRWRIPLKDIYRVTPSRAWWSSPALSLDRLCIEYGNSKWILVSPVRREEFMEALGLSIT